MQYEGFLEQVNQKDTVFLMDLAWHLHRYFYAFRHMHARVNGTLQPIGHVHGVLRELMNIKRSYPNAAIVFCEDGVPTWRKEIEPEYKAGRPALEYDIWQDVDGLLSLCCTVSDVYVAGRSDLEADDVMFSLAKRLEEDTSRADIFIFSGDNDLLQAVTDRVSVVRKLSRSGEMDYYDPPRVQEKYHGVEPQSLPIFRAIVGDKSDNLEGLYRFPRKLASRICGAVEQLSDIPDLNMEGLTPAMRKHLDSLRANMDIVTRNYELMRLRVETSIGITRICGEDKALECLEKLRIRSLPDYFEITIA